MALRSGCEIPAGGGAEAAAAAPEASSSREHPTISSALLAPARQALDALRSVAITAGRAASAAWWECVTGTLLQPPEPVLGLEAQVAACMRGRRLPARTARRAPSNVSDTFFKRIQKWLLRRTHPLEAAVRYGEFLALRTGAWMPGYARDLLSSSSSSHHGQLFGRPWRKRPLGRIRALCIPYPSIFIEAITRGAGNDQQLNRCALGRATAKRSLGLVEWTGGRV